MFHDRRASDDAVLNAIAAANQAEFEEQFRDDRPRDNSGLLPWSEVNPGRLVTDAQHEVDRLTTWLDELIYSRFGPGADDAARRPETNEDDEGD